MEVHQRQDLGHLRGLSGPRRQDRRAEPRLLPGHLVDPTMVHPWGPDFDRSSPGHQRSGNGVTVADHQSMSLVVTLLGERGHIGIDLGLHGGGQHAPRTFGDQFVQRGRQFPSASVSTCTLSIGVPSSPAFHRQRLLGLFKEEGRRALGQVVHPQVLVIAPLVDDAPTAAKESTATASTLKASPGSGGSSAT